MNNNEKTNSEKLGEFFGTIGGLVPLCGVHSLGLECHCPAL